MMPRVLESPPGAVPILAWAREVPPGAVKQLQHIASQPYVVEHVAAMPDVHMAQGVAVGTVFATEAEPTPFWATVRPLLPVLSWWVIAPLRT